MTRAGVFNLPDRSLDFGCPWGGCVAPFGIAFWVMQLPLVTSVPGEGFNCELAGGNTPGSWENEYIYLEGASGQCHSLSLGH